MKKKNNPSEKIISLKVKNDWLDALEDLLTAELSEKEYKTAHKKVMQLWTSLVSAYDSEK